MCFRFKQHLSVYKKFSIVKIVPVKMTFAAGPEYAKVAKEKDLYIEKTIHR